LPPNLVQLTVDNKQKEKFANHIEELKSLEVKTIL